MYFVDRKKIEETLDYMNELLAEAKKHKFSSFMEKLYLERTVHMIIESMLDVGNMMIDGFIMRDPGSYEDIIDILVDEKVVPESHDKGLKAVILLRKHLVKEYMSVDHELLEKTLQDNLQKLMEFSSYVRKYLDNDLGVANAFIKND
ncbi:type VII toxin-antitoxin system HepT family RNase toxin [Virgibacillus doumboii]|uniref:type VII toxin-antitoxin system HepT family RNase toxin n=1 Tax=Virgibacillus doumboii TaxID=2697503 RepID=UPI0013E0E68D|nr:DUF86 domain-containing protein [Virgibacillus doumboii]